MELNEAFAAQSLACLAEWPDLDPADGQPARRRHRHRPPARLLRRPARWGRRPAAAPPRRAASGVAAICIGVGQGLAVDLMERMRDVRDRLVLSTYPWSTGQLHPPTRFPDYRSTVLRSPARPLVMPPAGLTELTGPCSGAATCGDTDADLTAARRRAARRADHRARPGARRRGRPVRGTLVEVWQANAAGRYIHHGRPAPRAARPQLHRRGPVPDRRATGRYRFVTVKPGAYPWRNHHNAWRPAHIHFSLFGRAFTQRLVTQMYFPGDPLFFQDPIFNAVPDERARKRLVSAYDHDATTGRSGPSATGSTSCSAGPGDPVRGRRR